jgi:hypothetical protein
MQRGGAVRTLTGMYADAAAMVADMDFYTITSHGETVGDQTFFMVPPDTYLVFSAHSGDYAYATGEAVDEISMRTTDRDAYYQMLYERLFTEGGSKFDENLYIYEPGDILPDYALIFRNNMEFFSQFGVYKLPLEPSPVNAPTSYYGNPVAYIKLLLDAGLLMPDDIDGLRGNVARDLRTKTYAEIEATVYTDLYQQLWVPALNAREEHLARAQEIDGAEDTDFTPADRHPLPYAEMGLYDKLEYHCCRANPANLVRGLLKPSLNYQMRLINLLRQPALAPRTGHKRFLFMHFCRVSVADIAMDYSKVHPRLLRAVSFSGKCVATRRREEALNLIGLTFDVCSMEPAQKTALLQTEAGRRLITILKRVALVDWSSCLPPKTYASVSNDKRLDLISDYTGYLTMEEVLDLGRIHADLAAFPSVHGRLATLAAELEKAIAALDARKAEKLELIRRVYTILHTFTGFGKTKDGKKIIDFLNLRQTSVPDIEQMHRILERDAADPAHPLLRDMARTDDPDENESTQNDIRALFALYVGKERLSKWVGPIEIPVLKDTTVVFGAMEGGGRRRRLTRRRR